MSIRRAAQAVVSQRRGDQVHDAIAMPADLCLQLLGRAGRIHRLGMKSYGLLIADPGAPGYPFAATGVVFLDSRKNRRNDPGHRAAFRAQGEYFRQFKDAGFVADPGELLAACRAIEDSGREIVAPFHSHRRQPANFSLIDYRLHNPAFAWHLIISLRDPLRPAVQPFPVRKELSDFGISARDTGQSSELAYEGPEVAPLALVAHGTPAALHQLASTLNRGSPRKRHRPRRWRSPLPQPETGNPRLTASRLRSERRTSCSEKRTEDNPGTRPPGPIQPALPTLVCAAALRNARTAAGRPSRRQASRWSMSNHTNPLR
jgi:proteasome lid subunit RPN8/RPN11